MAAVYQHTTKTSLTVGVLFCAALLLCAYTKERPAVARLGASWVGEFLRPFQALHGATRHSLLSWWGDYIALLETQRENVRLKTRLAALEAQNSQLLEFKKENVRIRGLLRMAEEAAVEVVVANVIGYDPSNWVQVITIDKGSRDGVRVELPVLERNGVVGHVISCGAGSARVLLLSDRTSGIDAIVQEGRARGVLQGMGRFRARLEYVLEGGQVKVGDRVITSGMDNIFPKGLLLGVVSSVGPKATGALFQEIEVRSSIDFTKLEMVEVLVGVRPREDLD
ncbi:MAG: rod shape-determining protein MreC [Deltaproteobacteria bacterium]|nr:rod shape-determining protein MreC [Deltaproteobacteria bacterium]